jgi:hypothetical protein
MGEKPRKRWGRPGGGIEMGENYEKKWRGGTVVQPPDTGSTKAEV